MIEVEVPTQSGPEITVTDASGGRSYTVTNNNTVQVETQAEADVLLQVIEGASIVVAPQTDTPSKPTAANASIDAPTTNQGA